MNTTETTRDAFRVRSFDADALGRLTTPRLLGYLLEAAGTSADSLGIGVTELQRRGFTWVLGRLRIVVDEPIALGDTIEVETWPSGLVRSAAWRDFRVCRDGTRVARATSVWFAIDLRTRAVVQPDELLPQRLHPPMDHELVLSRSVENLGGSTRERRTYGVQRADIDLNHHVTAATYISWAIETVPESSWASRRLGSLDVQYLAECHLGDIVISTSAVEPSCEDRIFHRIERESDGRELARLQTEWVLR